MDFQTFLNAMPNVRQMATAELAEITKSSDMSIYIWSRGAKPAALKREVLARAIGLPQEELFPGVPAGKGAEYVAPTRDAIDVARAARSNRLAAGVVNETADKALEQAVKTYEANQELAWAARVVASRAAMLAVTAFAKAVKAGADPKEEMVPAVMLTRKTADGATEIVTLGDGQQLLQGEPRATTKTVVDDICAASRAKVLRRFPQHVLLKDGREVIINE